jgi:hypothetical protein
VHSKQQIDNSLEVSAKNITFYIYCAQLYLRNDILRCRKYNTTNDFIMYKSSARRSFRVDVVYPFVRIIPNLQGESELSNPSESE